MWQVLGIVPSPIAFLPPKPYTQPVHNQHEELTCAISCLSKAVSDLALSADLHHMEARILSAIHNQNQTAAADQRAFSAILATSARLARRLNALDAKTNPPTPTL